MYTSTIFHVFVMLVYLQLPHLFVGYRMWQKRGCIYHTECGSAQVCKENICTEVTTTLEIASKQMCPGVFKKLCYLNKDCNCPSEIMICKNYECVFPKENVKTEIAECSSHTECGMLEICKNKKCREVRTFEELYLLENVLEKYRN
ncbi:uncharacterized protein LOC130624161 [Hydractinia symbiolongicarpus]|uniref:uncharacterized protein LOC130624161 n=1 Tax=Hydractinia symbiolongicarpus TaxID=13093 RepID=UPI00254D110F|nr:uncharacterized protein LOC130624161 [Hydractinia symbiolongicarpus]